ncbi:hypothetical protein PLESTF_001285900 [Pleodorina starrii]|nr:hypothetical protein PLESTF_001285900 [Pleodorina starrii]
MQQDMDPLNRTTKWGSRVQDVGPTPPFATHEAVRGPSSAQGNTAHQDPAGTSSSTADRSSRGMPKWITYDRKVLGFGAYFREDVPYSPLESWRVRKVTVRYYMETDEVEVVEMREVNSGLPQGILLKRHRAVKEDGSPLLWPDLHVGGTLILYRRTYHLVAVDGATRAFYEQQGQQQPPDETYPEGPYEQHRKALEASARGRRPPVRGPPPPSAGPPLPSDPEPKDLAISPRGLGSVFETLRVAPSAEQEARDTAVLRFGAAWDNTAALFGDVLPFALSYHVEDGTVEVREVARRNSGRDPFPLLLSRRRLPKATPPVLGRPMSPGTRRELNIPYYDWRDLYMGATVNVYGRKMLLYDCDDPTRAWLKKYVKGLSAAQLTPIQVDFDPFGAKRPPLAVPPHGSGIGSDEDSLQNCLRLVPRPVTRSYTDYLNKWNKVLRFEATMVPLGPDRPLVGPHDAERRFVVSFHPVDGTLSVWEPKQVNSGMEQGCFLDRHRVGSLLEVFGRGFQLLDADAFTLLYMEQNAYRFPWADFDKVLSKLLTWLAHYPDQLPDRLRADLLAADSQGSGYVTKYKLYDLLTGLGCDLSPHEVITLVRQLGADRQGLLVEQLLAALRLAPPPPPTPSPPSPPAEPHPQEEEPARVPFPAPGLRSDAWPPHRRVSWGPDAAAVQAKATAAAGSGGGCTAAPHRGLGPTPGHPRVDAPPAHYSSSYYSDQNAGSGAGGGGGKLSRRPSSLASLAWGESSAGGDDRRSTRDTPEKSWRGSQQQQQQQLGGAFGSSWMAAAATGEGPAAASLGTPSVATPSALGAAAAAGGGRAGLAGSSFLAQTGVKQPASLWQTTNMAFGGVGHSSSFRRR